MAISFVGGNTGNLNGTTATTFDVSLEALTGGSGSAALEGDLVIVVVGTGALADRSIGVNTSGYTELVELYQEGLYNINDVNMSVSWKIMGSTPDTVVTIDPSGATSDAIAAAVHVWRGVDTSTPFDVIGVSASGDGIGRPNPGSITPVTSGAVVVAAGAAAATDIATFTSSDLSNVFTIIRSDTYPVGVGIGSASWTSGAFDPAEFGGGSTSSAGAWAAFTMALMPLSTSPTRSPGSASLTVIGNAPTSSVFVTPGSSSVSVTVTSPSLFVDEGSRTLVPDAAEVAISAATPSTGIGPVFTPDAGSVVVAVGDPVIAKTDHKLISVDVVVVAVSGATPVVGVAEQTIISPDHVSVSISTNVVNAVQNELPSPSSAALSCISYAVALQRLFSSTPDTETLVIAGFAPSLLESVSTIAQPGQYASQVSCTVPEASVGVVSQPGASGIVVSGNQPSLTTYRVASPASAGLSVTGNATGLSQGVVCAPGSYAMSVSGIDPTQLASVLIEVGKTTVVIEPETAGIIEHHLPSGGADELVVARYAPVVLADSHEIEVGAAALTVIGVAPAAEEGATLVIVGGQPSIGEGLAQCFSAEARVVPAMMCEDIVYERGWE